MARLLYVHRNIPVPAGYDKLQQTALEQKIPLPRTRVLHRPSRRYICTAAVLHTTSQSLQHLVGMSKQSFHVY